MSVSGVTVGILSHDRNWLGLRWTITGAQEVMVPRFRKRGRADGLWQTTCFEMFVKPPGVPNYTEFNLSPSRQWAAYDFTDYRAGPMDRPVPRDMSATYRRGGNTAIFDGYIPAAALPELPAAMALTAVIEETGGVKSYWSLRHSAAAPDFHDPACFTAPLTAPENP
nr:DOMON-like domain-containing protein [Allopontixanthobacter sediminis]